MAIQSIPENDPAPPSLRVGRSAYFSRTMLRRLRNKEGARLLNDEELLTYLCAYGYAIDPFGPQQLASVLLEGPPPRPPAEIWLEVVPESPRIGQDGSKIDMALGDLKSRDAIGTGGRRTISGVSFSPPAGQANSWVALVDCKCLSDSSVSVTNDPLRNQFVRTIEDALFMRSPDGQVPAEVHVVLLTPALFRENPGSRLYGYKFREYESDSARIIADLALCRLDRRDGYDLHERVRALRLHWVTYEEVITGMPPSPFRRELVDLISRSGSVLKTPAIPENSSASLQSG